MEDRLTDTRTVFSNKAEKYARYRWDYAPQAVEALFATAGLGPESTIADIGAGTGILTCHFLGRVSRVVAVEPNREMREQAIKNMTLAARCLLLAGRAEELPLANRSVDLLTVATAINWFDPEPARREILRVLKPGGWLGILNNDASQDALSAALDQMLTEEYGVAPHPATPARRERAAYYFGSTGYQVLRFPFTIDQTWEGFLGALLSTSFIPDEEHPLYPKFERAAQDIYNQWYPDGIRTVRGETCLFIGQPG